jgi:hypothetical protein
MPTTISFTGSGFLVTGVSQLTPDSIKLTFSQPPLATNPSGTNDSLNVSNYSVSGPAVNSILNISSFTSDSVLITFASGLVAGNWTLIVSNVHSATAAMIVPNPTVVNFVSSGVFVPEPLGGGALNISAETILKKHAGIFSGKTNWDALWAALAAGDDIIADTSASAFEQLFLSKASGKYLEDRVADEGYHFPQGLGLDDEIFRNLILDIKSNKLTLSAFLKVLNAFYGDKKTRAFITSTAYEPFALEDGEMISIDIDGHTFNIEFESDDFSNIANATAEEICNKFNSEFSKLGLGARAIPLQYIDGNTYLEIFSGAIGLSGYVRIVGGNAQKKLLFPQSVNTTQATGTTWQFSKLSPLRTKVLYSSGTDPTISLLSAGDYVLITGSNVNSQNRGSFEIKEVYPDYFVIENVFCVPQTVAQAAASDFLFFSPVRRTVNSVLNPAIASQLDNQAEIILPVNIDINRTFADGGYLGSDPDYTRQYSFSAESKVQVMGTVSRTANTWTINTSTAHGLVTNDKVYIESLRFNIIQNMPEGVLTVASTPTATQFTATGINGADFSETVSLAGQYIYKKFKNSNGDIYLNSPSATANLVAGDTVLLENVFADNQTLNPESFKKLFTDYFSVAAGFTISEELDSELQKREFIYLATPDVTSDNFFKIDLKNETVTQLKDLPVASQGAKDGALTKVAGTDKIFLYLNDLSSHLYDISQNVYAPTPVSPTSPVRVNVPYAVDLGNGKVFIWGREVLAGGERIETFDAVTGYWRQTVLSGIRCDISGTRPASNGEGVVFVASGVKSDTTANTQYWLFNSYQGSVVLLTYPWASHRKFHDVFYHKKIRKYVVSGGLNPATNLPVTAQGVYTFDPVTEEWSEIIAGSLPIWGHHGWAIDNDRVALFGGYVDVGGVPQINDQIYIVNLRDQTVEQKTINTGLMGSLSLTSIYNSGKYLLVDVANRVMVFNHARKNTFSANFPKILKYSAKTGNTLKFEPVFKQKDVSQTACAIKTSVTNSDGLSVYPTITLFKDSTSPTLNGSYISDPKSFEFTAKTAVLNQDIDPDTAYSTLTFVDTSLLPASGYIIIGLGTEYQTKPIRYIQKISSTELQLENFISEKYVPTGLTANHSNGLLLDTVSQHAFYLTNPPELRLFAERILDSVKAAGAEVLLTVKYPEDWGLGNSQIDIDTPGPKISDAIYIWGNEQDLLRLK